MSLVRAERRRLFKRRFTRWMLTIGVLILLAIIVGEFFSSQKLDAAAYAQGQAVADQNWQQAVQATDQYKTQCEQAHQSGSTSDQFPQDCATIEAPPHDSFRAEDYLPSSFNFRSGFAGTMTVFAGILALVTFIIGASFVGAEWTSGGMMNLLLWRPRRLQVYFTKMGTLLGGVLAVGVVLAGGWTAAFWGVATLRGSTAKLTPGFWQSIALTEARGLALVLVATAIGFTLASIGRHTAIALGVAAGTLIVFQVGVAFLLNAFRVQFWERYIFTTYISAWMGKTTVLEDYSSCDYVRGECHPKTLTVTWEQAGLLFLALIVILTVVGAWQIRRRDIT
jgi:hypothetical protein